MPQAPYPLSLLDLNKILTELEYEFGVVDFVSLYHKFLGSDCSEPTPTMIHIQYVIDPKEELYQGAFGAIKKAVKRTVENVVKTTHVLQSQQQCRLPVEEEYLYMAPQKRS